MNYMLCRNRVRDVTVWKRVLDSYRSAQEAAGLHLREMWASTTEPGNIFFLFQIDSVESAKRFISDPEAAKAGESSGVLDGEYHFVMDLFSAS